MVDHVIAPVDDRYKSCIDIHFVKRCRERGLDMTYELADKLNEIACYLNRNPKQTSKYITLYLKPSWCTKIYQITSNNKNFYLVFDARKDRFVTAITHEQMKEREEKRLTNLLDKYK